MAKKKRGNAEHCSVCPAKTTKRYCSTRCKNWAARHPGQPLTMPECIDCGGPTPGLKFKHCGCWENRPNINCAYCGDPFKPKTRTATCCSKWCRNNHRRAPASFQARFGRVCEFCGDSVSDDGRLDKRFCSKSHQVQHNQAIRRARRKKLPAEHIDLATILERDGTACHLCTEDIVGERHLDHIIPLSLDDSPGHVWENVAFAHPACNIGKNNRVTDHDWALYQELCALRALGEVV